MVANLATPRQKGLAALGAAAAIAIESYAITCFFVQVHPSTHSTNAVLAAAVAALTVCLVKPRPAVTTQKPAAAG